MADKIKTELREWEAHISDPDDTKKGFALCGERIGRQFHLTSLDHAFGVVRNGSRINPAQCCAKIALDMFSSAIDISKGE